jgi:hypothetical protein
MKSDNGNRPGFRNAFALFKDNIPLAEFVLRIITDKPDLILNWL